MEPVDDPRHLQGRKLAPSTFLRLFIKAYRNSYIPVHLRSVPREQATQLWLI